MGRSTEEVMAQPADVKRYLVEVEWSGYSRGFSQYEVLANDAEQAKQLYWKGEMIFEETVRDDRETQEISSVVEVKDEQNTK